MNVGETYKVTISNGQVFTGQFQRTKNFDDGEAFILSVGNSTDRIIWFDEVEAIEPIKYSYTPSESRSQRGIGVPRG